MRRLLIWEARFVGCDISQKPSVPLNASENPGPRRGAAWIDPLQRHARWPRRAEVGVGGPPLPGVGLGCTVPSLCPATAQGLLDHRGVRGSLDSAVAAPVLPSPHGCSLCPGREAASGAVSDPGSPSQALVLVPESRSSPRQRVEPAGVCLQSKRTRIASPPRASACLQMFPLPQKECREPATCLGSASAQDVGSGGCRGDVEGECSKRAEVKPPQLCGVGDPMAMFCPDSSCLSSRGRGIKRFWDSAEEGYRTYHMDEYDEDKNPNGVINLGTSENKLCFDLLSRRLTQSDMLHVEPSLLQYPDWRGHLFLREEVAKFLSYYCKSPAPLKPENVVVLNGCASIFSALATVLCEAGEAFLIPTPYYGAITQHVCLYGNVRLAYVYLASEVTGLDTRPFQLTVEKLETALQGASSQGVKVKGLILINPQNPLGDIYSPGELQEFLGFAKRHSLHVVMDEIYMLSVFEESLEFHSVLSLERLPDPQRTHVLWATSKDFGMSGLRFGTLYTENQDVASAVASLCRYHGLSGLVQYQMAQLLQDRDWINHVYLLENRARLKAAHSYVSEELRALGVPFLSRGAGFFIWVDLRKYLCKGTFEEELLLWRRFLDNKVLLTFGKAFECKEPGWFRVVFAEEPHRLRLGMQRVWQVLEGKCQGTEEAPPRQAQEPRDQRS